MRILAEETVGVFRFLESVHLELVLFILSDSEPDFKRSR
jgi:hypothetical protein